MSRYVVAGVTGHVGSKVAGELIAGGARIKVIVRDPKRGERWFARGAEVAVGSLDDAEFLTRALDGAAGFFTLLPEDLSYPDFHGQRRRIADATARAVDHSGVPHVVMQSAISASLPDKNGPGKDLHDLEQALLATGAKLTRNRACYFQENVAASLAPARQAGIFPNFMPSADAAFPMIATSDVGRFAADALRDPTAASEVIDLMGPAYSMRQVAEKLGLALGKPLQVVDVPAAAHETTLTQAGLPAAFAQAVAELYAAFAAGLIRPEGDRTLVGATMIDEVLPGLVREPSRA